MLTWLVIIGGLKSIGRAAERLAPAKVLLYLVGGVLVLVLHFDRLPGTLALILREAFSLRAASGSAAGIGMMSPCATGSRAASTPTRPATAPPRWPTAPRGPTGPPGRATPR